MLCNSFIDFKSNTSGAKGRARNGVQYICHLTHFTLGAGQRDRSKKKWQIDEKQCISQVGGYVKIC